MSSPFTYQLPITIYDITFSSLDSGSISGFMGHTLHGALGHGIRRNACPEYAQTANTRCATCSCLYKSLFEPQPDIPPEQQARYKKENIPKPYYIKTPYAYNKQVVTQGDQLSWTLHVVGKTNPDLDLIADVAETMCNSGLGLDSHPWNVDVVVSNTKTIEFKLPDCAEQHGAVTVHFISPFITSKEKMKIGTIPFSVLVTSVLERYRTYTMCYGDGAYLPDTELRRVLADVYPVQITKQQLQWRDLKRPGKAYKSGKSDYFMAGWTGSIQYEKVPLWAIETLRQMETLSIGQHTTFGFGQYRIEIPQQDNTARKRVFRHRKSR